MTQHIYFLGIGGTLMGSLAQLAKAQGARVSGSDKALYPPMSDQLAAAEIEVYEGFDASQLDPAPDLVVIGNAGLPRGHPGVEYVLESGLRYVSGAEWLGTAVLPGRFVLAVAGTHGKTTTASMLAWILEHAGLDPGYLIGGVPSNFETSARLGSDPFFVVEADEYDTSYFDRRSKFLHYRPRTLVITNLEYDHADIFDDLAAIQNQFHHLLRTVPGSGLVVVPHADPAVDAVLERGVWTPVARIGGGTSDDDNWQAANAAIDGSTFAAVLNGEEVGNVAWGLTGAHNVANGLAALAAARHAGVAPALGCDALSQFNGVKRRMEVIARVGQVTVYDDFAHHPTAIRTTLDGLRAQVGDEEIVAVIEPRSHTMSLGTLRDQLVGCAETADRAFWFQGPNIKWDLASVVAESPIPAERFEAVDALIEALAALPPKKRHIVIMSNGSFEGIYTRLPKRLSAG